MMRTTNSGLSRSSVCKRLLNCAGSILKPCAPKSDDIRISKKRRGMTRREALRTQEFDQATERMGTTVDGRPTNQALDVRGPAGQAATGTKRILPLIRCVRGIR